MSAEEVKSALTIKPGIKPGTPVYVVQETSQGPRGIYGFYRDITAYALFLRLVQDNLSPDSSELIVPWATVSRVALAAHNGDIYQRIESDKKEK